MRRQGSGVAGGGEWGRAGEECVCGGGGGGGGGIDPKSLLTQLLRGEGRWGEDGPQSCVIYRYSKT